MPAFIIAINGIYIFRFNVYTSIRQQLNQKKCCYKRLIFFFFKFFTLCIMIKLLHNRPAKRRQYNILIFKTTTCFGPHWPVIRECSFTKQSLDHINISNHSPVLRSSTYDLLQLQLYILQHLHLNFMTLVIYLF